MTKETTATRNTEKQNNTENRNHETNDKVTKAQMKTIRKEQQNNKSKLNTTQIQQPQNTKHNNNETNMDNDLAPGCGSSHHMATSFPIVIPP